MTWSASVGGHTPAPEGESSWEKVEQELYAKIKAALKPILSNPKYGAPHITSWFTGNHVTGHLHDVAEPAETLTK